MGVAQAKQATCSLLSPGSVGRSIVLSAFVFTILCGNSMLVAEVRKPNVVWIWADNLAHGDVGVHGNREDDAKVYAAMVNMVDRQVGEILAMLKDLGLDRDTIVFFSGDNGGNTYFSDRDHPAGWFAPNVDPKTGQRLRGGKGNLYEGGLRVPFIVRWADRIMPGQVSDHLGYFADIMPTLAEQAHVPVRKGAWLDESKSFRAKPDVRSYIQG